MRRFTRNQKGHWLKRRLLLLVLASLGCAASPSLPSSVAGAAPAASSWVCRGLVDRFFGLPADSAPSAAGPAPLAGRWWIRSCSFALAGPGELQLRLDGPGWYWVDSDDGDIALHQQVAFDLDAVVTGKLRLAYAGGVGSLWFEPTRDADVAVDVSTRLELHGASVWGSVLRRLPFLPVRSLTARRLSKTAARAFEARLNEGMTVTYDLFKGQADMALGQLRLGETPSHAFQDGLGWLENDRLLLPPEATQVFGPLEPSPLHLDVHVERGPGLSYRAICTRDMAEHLAEVATGKPERIPARDIVGSGSVTGEGAHSTRLDVEGCPYYLIVSSARARTTIAALRLRS